MALIRKARYPEILLCGYEHGGTTLLSDLFRANGYESGFECGVLMCERPRDFPALEEYWNLLLAGWSIDSEVGNTLIVDDFGEFYQRLTSATFPSFAGPFFDKTPKYMEQLGACLYRTDFIRHAVVVFRDPRAVFASQAKRLSPELPTADAVERNFSYLSTRYLSYFTGSAAHFWNPSVLFVPFEDLVTREALWLTILGNFVRGHPFEARKAKSRFSNVETGMRQSKVSEAMLELPASLQDRILEATALAAPFHSDPVSRSQYVAVWNDKVSAIETVLEHHGLQRFGEFVDGIYFEPMTYLLRYPDVLQSGINPINHFREFGAREGRRAA